MFNTTTFSNTRISINYFLSCSMDFLQHGVLITSNMGILVLFYSTMINSQLGNRTFVLSLCSLRFVGNVSKNTFWVTDWFLHGVFLKIQSIWFKCNCFVGFVRCLNILMYVKFLGSLLSHQITTTSTHLRNNLSRAAVVNAFSPSTRRQKQADIWIQGQPGLAKDTGRKNKNQKNPPPYESKRK